METKATDTLIDQPILAGAVEAMLTDIRRSVSNGSPIPAALALMQINDNGTEMRQADFIPVDAFLRGDSGKEALAYAMHKSLSEPDSPINALMLVIEAKLADPTNDFLPMETVMIVVRRPGLSQPLIFQIDREKKELKPRKDLPMSKFGGRLTGIGYTPSW